jgi:hypothetical protein
MRIPDNLAFILLGLYLVIQGALQLAGGGVGVILGLLAFAAGVLFLLRFVRT